MRSLLRSHSWQSWDSNHTGWLRHLHSEHQATTQSCTHSPMHAYTRVRKHAHTDSSCCLLWLHMLYSLSHSQLTLNTLEPSSHPCLMLADVSKSNDDFIAIFWLYTIMEVTMVKIEGKISSFCLFLNFFSELTARGNTDQRAPWSYESGQGSVLPSAAPGEACKICQWWSPTLDKLNDHLWGWGECDS